MEQVGFDSQASGQPGINGCMKYSSMLWMFILILTFLSCKEEKPQGYIKYQGETMGTYYAITFETTDDHVTQEEIDQLLVDFNQSLSTYIEDSFLSVFNRSGKGIAIPRQDTFMEPVFLKAHEYYMKSDGYYDPTIMPLVNYWGFGYEEVDRSEKREHQRVVDSLINFVVMDSIEFVDGGEFTYLRKLKKGMQLDFSSIAKGYGIDVLVSHLQKHGIKNYLVDIGGEAKASGFNSEGRVWRLAINTPTEDADVDDMELIINLDDKAIATSGNYRNVYTIDGKKYSHTINPRTGFPERSSLLSATVIADQCMDADAIATILMLLGVEKGINYLEKEPKVEACMIYDEDGDSELEKYYTEGFEEYIFKGE